MMTTTQTEIEPGVLRMFRLFTGTMGVIQAARLLGPRLREPRDPFVLATALLMGALFVYLSWPRLRTALGTTYLPLALVAATAGPILADAVAVRAVALIGAGAAAVEPMRLYFWLIPPLILVSAQYGLPALLAFTAGSSLLPVLLLLGSAGGGLLLATAASGLSRLFLFTLAGALVVQVSAAQRGQRRELAERNRQLAHYASAQEQLAVSRERNRLARELHDTLAHTLSAISVQLGALDVTLARDPEGARATLRQLQSLARDGLHESRRALQALRANPVESLGLLGALRQLAEQAAQRAGLALQVRLPPAPPPLRPEAEQQLYRIAEEALANSVRHARATQLELSLTCTADSLELCVEDDGAGFDPQAEHGERYGLRGMGERAALLGGALHVEGGLGRGTRVRVLVALGVAQ